MLNEIESDVCKDSKEVDLLEKRVQKMRVNNRSSERFIDELPPLIVLVEKSNKLVVVHPSNVICLARQHLLLRDFWGTQISMIEIEAKRGMRKICDFLSSRK